MNIIIKKTKFDNFVNCKPKKNSFSLKIIDIFRLFLQVFVLYTIFITKVTKTPKPLLAQYQDVIIILFYGQER